MAISFNQALLLIIIPFLIYPVYLWYRDAWYVNSGRRILIVSLRIMILLSLLLALAGMEINYKISEQAVAFIVDKSASCKHDAYEADNFISEALKHKKPGDMAAVVVFGEDAKVELPLSGTTEFTEVQSQLNSNFTNIESALRLGAGLLPDDKRKRIVLISDGRENTGNALSEMNVLAERGIRLDVVTVEKNSGPEVRVEGLKVPQRLFTGEKFPIKLSISSTETTPVQLRIFMDDKVITEESLILSQGNNQLQYAEIIEDSGLHSFKLDIESKQDTISGNNTASAFAFVAGKPQILLLEGSQGEGKNISRALDSMGIKCKVISPLQMPLEMDELKRYGVLILDNVPAEDLNERAMEAIHAAVRDMGMGLVMVGGEESFGPGGYFRTPVEEALPVYMDLRGKAENPSLGLMMVIDKSGSMSAGNAGPSKIELAREAAIQASKILSPQDTIGVVAFDFSTKWVVKPAKVEKPDSIQSDIASIRAGGGTDIYPALAMAYTALKGIDSKYKHIILLTDGQSATSGNYLLLSRRMESQGISLSTVAVGNDADTVLLEQLADWGKGRYYFTDDVYNLPRIFTKETMKAQRQYLVEEEFEPIITDRASILEGIKDLPVLQGYVASSAKKTARVLVSSHQGDPILAQWQYGLGRAVVFTSDSRGKWSAAWNKWPEYKQLWANIISWSLPRTEDAMLEVQADIQGNRGHLKLESREFGKSASSSATVLKPDLSKQELILKPTVPGRYEADFYGGDPGVYFVSVKQEQADGLVKTASRAVAVSYSPEYSNSGLDQEFLGKLLQSGGGAILSRPEEVFADNLRPVTGVIALWPYLLMIALVLFLLDIAVRRLNFTMQEINSVAARINDRWGSGGEQELSSETVTVLREQKIVRGKTKAIQKAAAPKSESDSYSEKNVLISNIEKSQSQKTKEPESSTYTRLLEAKQKRKNK